MAYNRNHARRLLNTSEMALFEASLTDSTKSLSAAELKKKIDRTRKARDKFTDLYRRQSLASRDRTGNKRGASGVANERTQQKAKIFAEMLVRFDKALDKCERAEARETKRAMLERARAAKGGGGRTTPKKSGAAKKQPAKSKATKPAGPKEFMDEGAKAARNRAKVSESPRNKKINASVGARGRRTQAKRDAR